MRYTAVWFALWIGFAVGCHNSSEIAHDFNTPEGAILSLEDAYRARDVEAAVKCKDFDTEAKMMLHKLNPEFSDDPELLAKTAEVLELGFRAEMKSGFPNFDGVTSTFPERKPYQGRDDIVEVTELCTHAGGGTTTNTLHVAKVADGWRVIALVED